MYARLNNGIPEIASLPDRTQVSLPSPLTDEALANLGLYRIKPGNRPADTITNRAVQTGLAFANGEVVRQWESQPRPLEEAKAALRERVNAIKTQRQQGGAPTPQGIVDSDVDSRNKLNGAVLMAMLAAQAGQPFAIAWTLADNSNVALDGPGLIAMASAVGQHVAACHAHAQALKAAIDLAEDHAALDAIDVEAGWP